MNLFEDAAPPQPTISLRPYQQKAVEAVEECKARGLKRVLLVMPTGTGKTTTFAELVRRETGNALILAHRVELLDQACKRIQLQVPGRRAGIEGGDIRAPRGCNVVVAGVQTVGRENSIRLAGFDPSLLVIDEAHHAPAASYQTVMESVGSYDGRCFTVGVTATPHRMDNHPLHGDHKRAIFEEVAFSYTLKEAIADSYLCDIRGIRVESGTDLTGVKTTAGDYNQAELERAVNTEERNALALKAWFDHARDRRTIVFCTGVDHSKRMAEKFADAGIAAASIDGRDDPGTRAHILNRFRSGDIQVLCNVQIATEGFDLPEIACVLMLRPTKSWALFTQMVGRGLRLASGKSDCLVVDVTDNSSSHSLASLPAILGLPPKMNLNGMSAIEAAEKFEKLSSAQQGFLMGTECDWKSLEARVSTVNLLESLTSDVMRANARYAWVKVTDSYFVLGAGSIQKKDHNGNIKNVQRQCKLTQDALGLWTATLFEALVPFRRLQTKHEELGMAVREAEKFVDEVWRQSAILMNTKAAWRGLEPTEKQIAMLKRHHTPPEVIAGLNRSEASALITKIMESK